MVNTDGTTNLGIGCAGIHYNVKLGDPCDTSKATMSNPA